MIDKFTIICARNNQGFFTNFFHTLQHLKEAELEGRIPIVYWVGGAYSSKEKKYNGVKTANIWEYYFEPVSSYSAKKILPKTKINPYGQFKPEKDDPRIKISFKFHGQSYDYEPGGCWDTTIHPPEICLNNPTEDGRKYVNGLIERYIEIKPIVLDKMNEFYQQNMQGSYMLGVHIRGCNDLGPSQGVDPMKRYVKYTRKYLEKYPDAKVFVATDYRKALQIMVSEFGDKICFRKVIRSKNRNPVQYGCHAKRKHRPGGPRVGEEVLIDALLLSKCQYLIRGFSNVASCASFFNPRMGLKYICKYNRKLRKYLGIKT